MAVWVCVIPNSELDRKLNVAITGYSYGLKVKLQYNTTIQLQPKVTQCDGLPPLVQAMLSVHRRAPSHQRLCVFGRKKGRQFPGVSS